MNVSLNIILLVVLIMAAAWLLIRVFSKHGGSVSPDLTVFLLCLVFLFLVMFQLSKQNQLQQAKEKKRLGVDDKGYYIRKIGNHHFIVNYGNENRIPPVHDPGCPCGLKKES